jgi:hypothetical protein
VLAGVPVPAGLLTETPTELPRPTATPLPADTATATPITTATVTPTPTECRIYFVDVPPDNTFYDTIRCLSCRGIVSGYPCGGPGEPCPGPYYRPGNNVTRGQTSKIVSLAAGFAEPVPSAQQTFEDVSPGSTFWAYIERLSSRGIVAGYPCGGAGEPCVGPGNRPYFRPNNNVTRGQLAKIVSGAAGYTETPTGQTFADVPPGSTFYLDVERIAARGIVGGYPCGGPGEPCPAVYYRPNNNATRGQMAKIAANAFYPNCDSPGPTSTPSPTRTPPPTPPPCGTWSIVPSPNLPLRGNSLEGVAVVNTNDIWAVGYSYDNGSPFTNQTLIEHWNGTSWSIVPSPNTGPALNILVDVTVVSATDIWAVGVAEDIAGGPDQTLIEHWNGTNWSIVASPNVGPSYNYLWDVVAVSTADVWAVGSYDGFQTQQSRPLVEHWNGTAWTIVPDPIGGANGGLWSVAAGGPHNIWTIGSYWDGNADQTLVEHWDGTSWSMVPSPYLGTNYTNPPAIAVVSATDIWAVGSNTIIHWDGSTWRVVPSPPIGVGYRNLLGVAVMNPTDVWAVGYDNPSNGDPYQALTEHWDGTGWSIMPNPGAGSGLWQLRGAAAVNANNVWAVGEGDGETLIEHFPGTCP